MKFKDVAPGKYFLISTSEGFQLLCRDRGNHALTVVMDGEKLRPNSGELVQVQETDEVFSVKIGTMSIVDRLAASVD